MFLLFQFQTLPQFRITPQKDYTLRAHRIRSFLELDYHPFHVFSLQHSLLSAYYMLSTVF